MNTKLLALIITIIIASSAVGATAYVVSQQPPAEKPQEVTMNDIEGPSATPITTPTPPPTLAPTPKPTAPPQQQQSSSSSSSSQTNQQTTQEPTPAPVTNTIYEWYLNESSFATYNFTAYNTTVDGIHYYTVYNTTDYKAAIEKYLSFNSFGVMDHNNTGLLGWTQLKVTAGDTTTFEGFIQNICNSHGWIKYDWHTGDTISRRLT